MKIEQRVWTEKAGWGADFSSTVSKNTQLVLIFGAPAVLKKHQLLLQIKEMFPSAHIMGCSTAGEIYGTQVLDDSLVLTAIEFEHTKINGGQIKLKDIKNSRHAGEMLAKLLPSGGLTHVFVLSDGSGVNGTDLVRGLSENLPEGVSVTGGLAGDGARFEETLVFWDSMPEKDTIAILGFYGSRLKVGYGSAGGWDPFGPERLITRSNGNVLYELDGQSALELYKNYLGEHAKGLPSTGLLFPLSMRTNLGDQGIVRTILSINENDSGMVFAGTLPEGAYVRFMKANFDRLIDGAIEAANTSALSTGTSSAHLAILISCVGRKLVLKQRVEEEVEGVHEILGPNAVFTGFYSYGEISPFQFGGQCELHNQTMTITTFHEE